MSPKHYPRCFSRVQQTPEYSQGYVLQGDDNRHQLGTHCTLQSSATVDNMGCTLQLSVLAP